MMSEIIDINSPSLLPRGVDMYAFTEEEYARVQLPGRTYRLTRNHPRVYIEYYIEAENEAHLDKAIS